MFRLPLLRAALWLGIAVTLDASVTMVTMRPGIAQQGPIRLFPQSKPAVTPDQDRPALTREPVGRTAPSGNPAPTRDFVVEGLAAPEVDAIGLAGPSEGGFDRTLWQGSDPDLMLALLSDLPVVTRVPPLRRLTERLLATGSPVGDRRAAGRLLEVRLAGLIAMGNLDVAKRLVDQLPPPATDSGTARRAAEVALLLGDERTACRLADGVGPTTRAEFWVKVAVYCRLAADDPGGAKLGLDLLREAHQTSDTAFFELVTAIADEAKRPPLKGLAEPSALHVALLALAEWPLPAGALAEASPPILAAAVRQPALVGTEQLAVTERAFLVGAAPAERVAVLYAEQADTGGAALAQIQSNWGPRTRALAYTAVREQSDPVARAELLDAAWRTAGGAERFLIAEVMAEPLIQLPVDRRLASAAPSVARALLAADLPVPAARWLSLLTPAFHRDTRLERASANLAPLFALAGVGGSDAVPRIEASTIEAGIPAATGDGAPAERLLALLEGVGAPIEADVWRQLLPARGERQESAPASALWRGLERSAAEGRVGDTVLLVLHMLDGRPESVHPEVLVACLRALRQVGLDQDARAIAVATALIDGF